MRVNVREVNDVIVVELDGRLVAGVGDEMLREVVNELLAGSWKKILLDLTQVPRIDSAGVGELVAGVHLAERFEARIKLVLTGGKVSQVLRLSRILPLLEVFEDEQEALASFA